MPEALIDAELFGNVRDYPNPGMRDRPGLVGVTFVTAYRLAELLGADAMAAAGRRPVSTPVVAAAVRRTLRRSAGWFAAVAEHPTTERRLVEAHRELSDLSDEELAVLAQQSRRAHAVVDVHRSVRAILAEEFHHEQDLARLAAQLVDARPAAANELGAVVIFAPDDLGASRATLLRSSATSELPVSTGALAPLSRSMTIEPSSAADRAPPSMRRLTRRRCSSSCSMGSASSSL